MLRLILALMMLSLAGCGTAYRPATTQSSPPAKPVPDSTETKPFRSYRLTTVVPASAVTDGQLTVERTFRVTSTFYNIIGWQTSRNAIFVSKGLLSAVDRDLSFGFAFAPISVGGTDATDSQRATTRPLSLSVLVKNASPAGVVIDWNAVTLVRASGQAIGVIHRGVKFNEASGVMAPSTVPPGATLSDFVFPKDAVFFTSGRYGGWGARQFFELIPAGESFNLYLPVKRGVDLVEYQFTFQSVAPGTAAIRWR